MNAIESQQICATCERALRHGSNQLGAVPGLIKRILNEKLWRERKIEDGRIIRLDSFLELIERPPLEGWGEDSNNIKKLIEADDEIMVLWRKAVTPKKGKRSKDNTDNVRIITGDGHGNSRSYTVARLEREAPELYRQVVEKKLSANAAAIQAGFRKKPTRLEMLQRDWNKATAKERERFLEWIQDQ